MGALLHTIELKSRLRPQKYMILHIFFTFY